MHILASALPGFRDLRGPVIAGYLWLVFIWLVARPDISHRPSHLLAGSLYDLAHDVGPIAVGIALSVAAYLLGSVSQALSQAVATLVSDDGLTRIYRRAQKAADVATFDERPSSRPQLLEMLQSGPGTEHLSHILDTASASIESLSIDQETGAQLYTECKERARSAGREVERELSLPATLLVGDRPELFAEVDRLRSEGELRLTVVLPLTTVFILFVLQASPFWLAALVPVLILFAQGVRRRQDAHRIIGDAMRIGSVQSSAVSRFDAWVQTIPERAEALESSIAQRERERELDGAWSLRESGTKSALEALESNTKSGLDALK